MFAVSLDFERLVLGVFLPSSGSKIAFFTHYKKSFFRPAKNDVFLKSSKSL